MTDYGSGERTIEVEVKFDVDADTLVPDWTQLQEVVTVADPDVRALDAHYVDTADGALARVGVAIRRRRGGPDAGWHLKGPMVDGAREEVHWPLGADGDVPAAVRTVVNEWTSDALVPLARIVSERTAYILRDARGDVVAEFVDDIVQATDLRAGVERNWREWEFELGPGAPTAKDDRAAFFATVAAIVRDAGARPASSASKLARALGH